MTGLPFGLDLSTHGGIVGGLLYGFVSAWLPVLNAEVFVAGVAAAAPHSWWGPVIAMSVALALGKSIQFVALRHGGGWLLDRWGPRSGGPPRTDIAVWRQRVRALGRRLVRQLDHPVRGPAIIALSSATGLPPLTLVTPAAAVRRTPLWVFVTATILGRIGLGLVLGLPIALARA
ncbi:MULTISPECIES: hypothetical protein [unclassified Janibacter]|uniref:hypothetical protein n=1 Tax=unclassified Janibacter TaxID=2649294 RepID=UPI003D01B3F1